MRSCRNAALTILTLVLAFTSLALPRLAGAQSGLVRACQTARDVKLALNGATRLSEALNKLTNSAGTGAGAAVQSGTPLYELVAGDDAILKDRAVMELLAAAQDGAVEWEAIQGLDLHPSLPDLVGFMQSDARYSQTVEALRSRTGGACRNRIIGAGGGACGITLPLETLAASMENATAIGAPPQSSDADLALAEHSTRSASMSHGHDAHGQKVVGGCERAPLVGPQSCGGFTMPLEDLGAAHEELADAAIDAIKNAGGDPSKAAENIAEVLQQPRWKQAFSGTCMGRHPIAFKALIYNLLLGYTSLGLAYAADPSGEFPFDYAASTLVLGAMWGEVACRTHYESPGASLPAGETIGFWKDFGQKYWAYTKMVPIEVAGLVFFSASEDAIRGKDIFSPEYLEKYGREALFIGLWDMAWGNVKGITILNPLYLRVFPGWAGRVNKFAEPFFTQGPARFVNHALIRNSPGVFMDLSLRVATRSLDTYSFLQTKTWFTNFAPSGEELEGAPLIGGPDQPAVLDELRGDPETRVAPGTLIEETSPPVIDLEQFAPPPAPASIEPAPTEPATTELTANQPTATQPTATQPTANQPTATQPTATELTTTEPTTTEPAAGGTEASEPGETVPPEGPAAEGAPPGPP